MPIRFRCAYCNRLLGIATRKAGMETICPHCGYTITVPVPQEANGRADDARTEQILREHIELSPEQWAIHTHADLHLNSHDAKVARMVHEIRDFAPPKGRHVRNI